MSKHNPIVYPTKDFHADYHLMSRDDLLKMDNTTFQKRVDELNMRVQFARRYYKGRYDERHRRWMKTLVKPLKTEHKLHLSLDALVAVSQEMKLTSKKR